MGIRQILESIRDGLAADTTLAEYCQGKFGKQHTVFLGLNWQDPPGQEFFPAIIIAEVDEASRNNMRATWRVRIALNIEDDVQNRCGIEKQDHERNGAEPDQRADER